MDTSLFHIDPITIGVVVAGFVGTWYTLKNDSRWHTEWIQKHDKECDEQRLFNNKLFTELQTSNAHLTTLTEGHEKRLDRIEDKIDEER